MIDFEQRRIWLRRRLSLGLSESGLATDRHPAFTSIAELAVAVTVLPADPLAPLLDFDREVPGAIPQHLTGHADRMSGASLNQTAVTGSHVTRFSVDPEKKESVLVLAGVARHGGAVAGCSPVGTSRVDGQTVYRLDVLTALVRTALRTQAAVNRLPEGEPLRDGPFELTVALPGATGAVLDGFAPGWANLGQGFDTPPLCVDPHPVVRVEFDAFPEDAKDPLTRQLTAAMSRVVNLFGTDVPLYARRDNQSAGVPRDY